MSNRFIQLLFLFCSCQLFCVEKLSAAPSPNDTIALPIYFRLGEDLLLKEFKGVNEVSLAAIDELLSKENRHRVSSIHIEGSASPEGNSTFNQRLAQRRAQTIYSYIHRQYPHLPIDSLSYSTVDVLSFWTQLVEKDPDVPRKERVLSYLRSNASLETKWANIRILMGGVSSYMRREIFPVMRSGMGCIVVFYPGMGIVPQVLQPKISPVEPSIMADSDSLSTDRVRPVKPIDAAVSVDTSKIALPPAELPQAVIDSDKGVALSPIDSALQTQPIPLDSLGGELMNENAKQSVERIRKPILALKTNLLFDAATLLNIEVEVPLGKRFSVAGEWIFPWWLMEKQQNCLQLLSGNVEGKYWFGNRDKREVLTGWFAGLYLGGGYYDLEWNRVGYQGEFFIAAGISGGFAHTIARNLRLEYTLGVGYMQTNYRKYEAKFEPDSEWHLYRRESGRYTWLGPTRAKVSLVWLINANVKKGGARR